jgi:ATP-binding cassette subfamily C protein CydD
MQRPCIVCHRRHAAVTVPPLDVESPPDSVPQRLLSLARQQPALLAAAVIFGLLAGLAVIAQAWLLSQAIDAVFLRHADLRQLRTPLLLLIGLACLRAAAVFASEVSANRFASNLQCRLRADLGSRLFTLGPAFTAGERSGELVTTWMQSVDALETFFAQVLPQLAFASLLPLSIAIVLLPRDWPSAVLLLATAPLIPLFLWLIGSASQAMTRRQWRALRWMSAYFYDILQGLTTLKSFNLSAGRIHDIADVSERYRRATLQVLRVGFLSAFVLEIVATLSTAIIAVEIGLRLLYGHLAFAPALFILILAPEFYLPLRSLGLRFHAATAGIEAARRVFELMDTPLPTAPRTMRPTPSTGRPPALRMQSVTYAYPGRTHPALREVSLELTAGSLTVVLGASGSGKSTLASLLLRFFDPDTGEILLDGTRLRELDLDAWRGRVGWVPQRPHLFHATLEENLRLGAPSASPADLARAVQRACLDEVVADLPLGLAAPIGERGERLSAGQAQRVAIGRAMLKDVPFLLLDEPTSALDVESEAILQRSLVEFASGRTTLIITHRLSWLAHADQVCILSEGQLAQAGAPEALRATAGPLRAILQAAEAA